MILLDNISVFHYKNVLIFLNNRGVASINLDCVYKDIDIVIKNNELILKAKNELQEKIKDNLLIQINKVISGMKDLIKKKLVLFGIGFRAWVYKDKLKNSRVVLKIGYSRDIVVNIPSNVKVTALKPTLLLLSSFDKDKVSQFMSSLRSLKVPDAYKGKGIQFVDEKITLKPGKQN